MKKFSYYSTIGFDYPKKPIQPSLSSTSPTISQVDEFMNLTIKYNKDIVEFNLAISEYAVEQNRLEAEFKMDLFIEFDVVNNPKAELCYSKAYSKGHNGGYEEVYCIFSDLVELIK